MDASELDSYPESDSSKVIRNRDKNLLIILFPEKNFSKNAIRLILMPGTIFGTSTCLSKIVSASAF